MIRFIWRLPAQEKVKKRIPRNGFSTGSHSGYPNDRKRGGHTWTFRHKRQDWEPEHSPRRYGLKENRLISGWRSSSCQILNRKLFPMRLLILIRMTHQPIPRGTFIPECI